MSTKAYQPHTIRLTPKERSKAKQIFDHFDQNSDGKLSLEEAKIFMSNYDIDPAFLPLAFEICDINKDGNISFKEFNSLFILLGELEDDPSIIYRNLFEKFDTDHNGFLDESEVIQFFKFLFKDVSDKTIKFYADYFDKDHNGSLDYDEIIKILDILMKKEN